MFFLFINDIYPSANDDISRNTLQQKPKLVIPPPAENPVTRNGQEWSGTELKCGHLPYRTRNEQLLVKFFFFFACHLHN